MNNDQIKYVNDRVKNDSKVLSGMNLINTIQSTKYGRLALNKANQRVQTRFVHYMTDVVGSRAVKLELPKTTKCRLMMVEYLTYKNIVELKEENVVNFFKEFGFGERQTRIDLIDALNPEDELSEDAMLSENDMDDIIIALSVCLYANLKPMI